MKIIMTKETKTPNPQVCPSSIAQTKGVPTSAFHALHLQLLAKYSEPPQMEVLIAAVIEAQQRCGVPLCVFPNETLATSSHL